MRRRMGMGCVAAMVMILTLATAGNALAHCDTLDGPVIPAADKALESGNPDPLLKLVNGKIHEGIHKYYMEAKERKAHAGESVEAGRAYVQAYVPYLHFVERLYVAASTPVAHGAEEGAHDAHTKPGAAAEHKH